MMSKSVDAVKCQRRAKLEKSSLERVTTGRHLSERRNAKIKAQSIQQNFGCDENHRLEQSGKRGSNPLSGT